MRKIVCHILLSFLLLQAGFTRVWAEEELPSRLQDLSDEAYRHYSARETEQFFEDVNRLKDVTEFSEYQETYYRACAYEASTCSNM